MRGWAQHAIPERACCRRRTRCRGRPRTPRDDPDVLHDGSNVLVELRPDPVIARVSTRPGGPPRHRVAAPRAPNRAPPGGRRRPAVRPSSLLASRAARARRAGAQLLGGDRRRPAGRRPSGGGAALRACHDALSGFPEPLPGWVRSQKARSLLESTRRRGRLASSQFELLEPIGERPDRTPRRGVRPFPAVHGDAHLRNVLQPGRDRCGSTGRTAAAPRWSGTWRASIKTARVLPADASTPAGRGGARAAGATTTTPNSSTTASRRGRSRWSPGACSSAAAGRTAPRRPTCNWLVHGNSG